MLDDTSHAYLHAITTGNTSEADRLGHILDVATQLEQQHTISLAVAAHDYADVGIAVFPLRPTGKTPLTRNGFKNATTDQVQISDWWAQWPDANIGIPTGHQFDVIDIDGPPGLATMYNGDQALADELTILGIALTSRDGGRHLYVPATGNGNKAALYPGVDYRGTGGYVVAPPSIGANGRRYTWTRNLTTPVAAAA